MLGLTEADVRTLYDEKIGHRTEPFREPRTEAVHP
jgi:hypothetical protein